MPLPALLDIASPQLAQRHQPSGLNSAFRGEGLSFADYVALTRDMLRNAHTKLGTPDIEKVIAGNLPFALKPRVADGIRQPYKRGILLTHGLTDSPYFMQHLADFFAEQGFFVLAVLLPGHGTQPGDLLAVTWQEWTKAVAYGMDRLAEEADEVYLGGFSTGATLSIYQSLRDARVRGLFLFSPALKITPRAAYARLHKLYSWLIPAAKWVTLQPDSDCYKYESFPKNGGAQMYALTRVVKARRPALTIPIFTVASADDTTVQTQATLAFMARTQHPASKLVIYSTTPKKIPHDFPAQNWEWMNSVFPEQRIISSSHLSIVLPADDAHYGDEGEYANCAHYYPHEIEKYIACRTHPARVAQGEITPENLQTGILRRLMFNPRFAEMKVSMQRFIASLPEWQ
jgi:esterase/lipase